MTVATLDEQDRKVEILLASDKKAYKWCSTRQSEKKDREKAVFFSWCCVRRVVAHFPAVEINIYL